MDFDYPYDDIPCLDDNIFVDTSSTSTKASQQLADVTNASTSELASKNLGSDVLCKQTVINRRPKKYKESPQSRLIKFLGSRGWTSEEINQLPNFSKLHWRLLGTVLVFPLIDTSTWKSTSDVVDFLRIEHPRTTAVVAYEGRIKGELRKPQLAILTPGASTTTIHIENGIKYMIDVSKVMFAAGNGTERMRFAHIDASKEIVIDMFAGIGYFTLPLAKHGRPDCLVAIEKNPDSANLLRQNILLNRIQNIVEVHEGDNREVASNYIGRADRVLMGYLPSAEPFIERALQFAKLSGAILHYHYVAKREDFEILPIEHITSVLKRTNDNRRANILHYECVKSYAPLLYHYVADIQLVT